MIIPLVNVSIVSILLVYTSILLYKYVSILLALVSILLVYIYIYISMLVYY